MTARQFVINVYPKARLAVNDWGCYIYYVNEGKLYKDLSPVTKTPKRAWELAKKRIDNVMLKILRS
jgi:hypothetical protein